MFYSYMQPYGAQLGLWYQLILSPTEALHMAQVIPEWPEVLCLFACDPRLTFLK